MKLSAKTKKRIRGSITILLVIILLPMMTFSALVVDMSRINMAKEMVASAGDLTMNTALANYDTILKDVYGLFAMSQEKTEEQLAKDLENYFAKTLTSYGVVKEEEAKDYVGALIGDFTTLIADAGDSTNTGTYSVDTTSFLELQNIKLTADRLENSSLAKSDVLRKQIIEYMKFRAPIELGMSFLDSLKSFETVDKQMEVVEKQVEAEESTQDVTQACAKLIKLIREYDVLVAQLDAAVKGSAHSTDGKDVHLSDYDTQVDKYLSVWGSSTAKENYTHINLMNMIFLAKAPSVSNVYLAKLNYAGGVYFVKAGGTGLVYDNSGISLNVSTKSSTAEAKTQVETQISNLNTSFLPTAKTYVGKSFIDASFLVTDRSSFNNEDSAINTFIEYEKFLKDQSADVKYSDVAKVLEELYKLGKYYDNYKKKIDSEINTAKTDWDNAKKEVTRIQGIINNTGTTLDGYITSINDTAAGYYDGSNDISCLKKYSSLQSRARSLLGIDLPALSSYSSYEAYCNGELKNGQSNVYEVLFNSIATELKKSASGTDQKVGKAALGYLSNTKGKTFEKYMKDEVNSLVTTNGCYKLLNCLLTNSNTAYSFLKSVNEYKTAEQDLAEAQAEVTRTKGIYDGKVEERKNVTASYNSCLKGFYDFGKSYQEDASNYAAYITTATNIINRETKAVQTQFNNICGNINSLKTKLDAISKQATTVWNAIDAYEKKLESWNTANTNYANANGADSFSKQSSSEIESSKSDYDKKSLEQLQGYITDAYNRYNNFYTYLCGDVYFKYGGKRLSEIGDATAAKEAAKSNIASISADIVTKEIAATSLTQLYKGGPGHDFNPYITGTYLKFLDPVLQIKFLKYLNSAYPEEPVKTTVKENGKEVNVEEDYNNTKNSLVNDSGKTVDKDNTQPTEAAKDDSSSKDKDKDKDKDKSITKDKFGYSYKNTSSISKTNLPSKDKAAKDGTSETQYSLSEEDGDVKASKGVGDQQNALSSILSGIGTAIKAGIENAYILTYIFENFSYNTMIQDAIIDGESAESSTALASLANAKSTLKDKDVLSKYVDKQKTLSNVTKKAENNLLYGAEIEYILFGNTSPGKNITYTKGSIYAIRFAFNCIFAFTNTEIRNTTMTAGLAVQAATMGVVPYKVVQIILQLAIAAAESAVDLDMMSSGLDVAVVKTADTWSLSVSSAVKSAGAFVADTAADAAKTAINTVAGGIQGVIDAGAGELTGAINNLKSELYSTAEAEVNRIADQMFSIVTDELEAVLNEMQMLEETTKEKVVNYVDSAFVKLSGTIEKKLNEAFAGNDIAQQLLAKMKESKTVDTVLNTVEEKINKVIEDTPVGSDYVAQIINQITEIKTSMVNVVTTAADDLLTNVETIATDAIKDVQTELDGYIEEYSKDMSDKAAKAIKDKVSSATDKFVANLGGEGEIKGNGKTSLASLIKFGYKEYLMLFVYIGICANDDAILLRTADVIQLNIQNVDKNKGSYSHKKGAKFLMKDACTYISISATADLDMFFMDLDLFANVVSDPALEGETEEELDISKVTTIRYKGMLGY